MGPEHGAGSGESAAVKVAKDILFGGVSSSVPLGIPMGRKVDRFTACRNGVKGVRTPI